MAAMIREGVLLEVAWACMRGSIDTDDAEASRELHRMACDYVAQAKALSDGAAVPAQPASRSA
jgi:hypothetical protein